jgi:hypothetical protein
VQKIRNNDKKSKRHLSPVHTGSGMIYKYVKHQKLLLKTYSEFNEKLVQEKIAEDPSILGLGELILKDKKRNKPGAGRLDLLFQEPDSNLQYEVEIQLSTTTKVS